MKEYTGTSKKAITIVKTNLWNLNLVKENAPVVMERLNEYLLNEVEDTLEESISL